MGIRVARSGRKHRVGVARILAALVSATHVEVDGDHALYIGVDDRGVELEVIVVPDDRRPGSFTVIHAMPTQFRRP